MLSKTLFIIASATLASCQLDLSSVPLATREAWCNSQTSACPLLCLQISGASGSPTSNNCSATTLDYDCLCSNGVTPNATEYSQTIPYYTCTEANNQCVAKCNGDSNCQYDCRTKNPCGAQDPKRVNATNTTATAAATTATQTPLNTGSTGAAPRMADMSHVYGLCVVVGGVVAGMATLL
ncbi:unnamed protein product [Penicillium salamii]|uniref:DUF7707 domain-containing protein n=1 Tax=Penicillium salamii TaxID=1612424 RepID=A0A9W4NAI1_9EURO|nr:unnamed protein product [Penicillium salamii]CAG8234685.1 unnamed protein product [Penicillium salamii]CAG8298412.1 unnamed protein product [Penicillium salamii]CAG8329793.1 unnamed protein product [Penicillium salamii]CAG8330001.1 unnamed protein product [Penicillium salamii]